MLYSFVYNSSETDTKTENCIRHRLFPAPLGIDPILFVTRSNGAFMSTCVKVNTRLGTEVYFPFRSMSAGRHPCEALVRKYVSVVPEVSSHSTDTGACLVAEEKTMAMR